MAKNAKVVSPEFEQIANEKLVFICKKTKITTKKPEIDVPFYFTYGSSPCFPFCEGYSVIYAKSEDEAREKHAKRYGYTKGGYLRFAFSYTYLEARELGIIDPFKCHEIITKE